MGCSLSACGHAQADLAGKTVVHVCAVGSTARVLLLNLARSVQETGARVGFAFRFDGQTEQDLRAQGFDCFNIPFSRRLTDARSHVAALFGYRRMLGQVRPDVVTLSTMFPGIVGRMVRRADTRVVLLAHGSFWDDGVQLLVRAVWDGIERLVAGRADLILTNNPDDRDDTVRAGNAPERVLHMAGGLRGIDLNKYTRVEPAAEERTRRRRGLGLPDGTLVGTFGRVTPAKGLIDLCRAATMLRDTDARFVFVGAAGGERGAGRTLAAIRALGDRATFLGWTDDPIPLMEACDIIVNPSLREGLGLVSVEAGALGLPVIATSTRGSRYAVAHGRTGLLVRPRSPDELARAIRWMVEHPEERKSMGRAGRERNRELFGSAAVNQRLVARIATVFAFAPARRQICRGRLRRKRAGRW